MTSVCVGCQVGSSWGMAIGAVAPPEGEPQTPPVISLAGFSAQGQVLTLVTDMPSQGVYVWGRFPNGMSGVISDGAGGFSVPPLEKGSVAVGSYGSTVIFDESGTSGTDYVLFAYQRIGRVDSNCISLSYTADNTAPVVESIVRLSPTETEVMFSEELYGAVSENDWLLWAASEDVTVTTAILSGRVIGLTHSAVPETDDLTLQFDGALTDMTGNPVGQVEMVEAGQPGDLPTYVERGVRGSTGTYLTATEALPDSPGMLIFVSFIQSQNARRHLISFDGTKGYVRSDSDGGDQMIDPTIRLDTGPGGVGGFLRLSAKPVAEGDRIHALFTVKTMDTGGGSYTAIGNVAVWDQSSGEWALKTHSDSGSSNGPNLHLSGGPLRLNERNSTDGAGFEGTLYRTALWTFTEPSQVPDITTPAVRDLFAVGAQLVDPAVAIANFGMAQCDFRGDAAVWNEAQNVGNLTFNVSGGFTDADQ